MTGPRRGFVALALCGLTGAACGIVAGGDKLSDAQQVIADLKLGSSDHKGAELTVVGAVDHADRAYRVGEPIGLSVEVSKPAYVAVLLVFPSGATRLVFPNREHPAALLPANASRRISDPGSSLRVRVDRPGTALFEFIASDRGASWLFARKPEGAADFAELGTTTRALAKDILTSLKPGRGAETAASHLAVRAAPP